MTVRKYSDELIRDFSGNVLSVGDLVVFSTGKTELYLGQIILFTPSKVRLNIMDLRGEEPLRVADKAPEYLSLHALNEKYKGLPAEWIIKSLSSER